MEKNSGVERFIGEKYKDAHVAGIKLAPHSHKALLEWVRAPRGFLIFQGCPGCGKTWTGIAITRNLYQRAAVKAEYPSVFYYPQSKLFDEFKALYQNKWGDQPLKERIGNSVLLTLDDFGATRGSEWQVEMVTQIIEDRYISLRPTIITTNLTFEEIGNTFHDRVRSRLEAAQNLVIEEWERDLRAEGL